MAADEFRPTPDELLAKISAAEGEPKTRGKLKIFLGYAAGVGKTYTMLEAARQRKNELDVAVAYVETHGRTETQALLEGLEIIPPRQVEHRGVNLPEMDIDAVLARHPKLALVDELAHTNAPDARHPKRYQDVEELLDAGIDVYTTLNIQHVESLRDVVAQITSVWMRETVPDSFVDSADEIEIVDLPPDELLKRLKDGKVYVPQQIAHATARFFRKGNLTALRELSMRTAARHVDRQTQEYMEAHAIPGPWASGERLLVCIGANSLGPKLVRSARRLAYQLSAEWFVVYIETPDSARLPPARQNRLTDTLRLAERMGAKTVTVQSNAVAPAVLDFARRNNITKIVVGKPRRTLWGAFRRSVALQIISQKAPFDVYIVGGERERTREKKAPVGYNWRNLRGYLWGVGLVILATLLGGLIQSFFSRSNLLMVYLLCVAVTSIYWGLGPAVMVSVLSVLVFVTVFVPPIGVPVVNAEHLFALITLLVVGIVISYLTYRIRAQTEAARRREWETAALYALSRDLSLSNDLPSYINAIIKRTRETFGREAVIFLSEQQGKLKPYSDKPAFDIDNREMAAALWAFQHQKTIGRGTDTLPNARGTYWPLVSARGAIGVMALWSEEGIGALTIEQERLLSAFADLDALAIESIVLTEEAKSAEILRATEKLHTALLNSISQDLRAPLVYIIGALNRLKEGAPDAASAHDLVLAASNEAETLNHLITNLIDQSRIDAGAVRISKQPASIPDIISAALDRLTESIGNREVNIVAPPDLPQVPVDFPLMVQALVNILDNSFKYSHSGSPVDITVRREEGQIQIEIADRGIGIPPEDLERVFDKFYRVQRPDNVIGTGLGLSISKGFIEAQGGRIRAENRPGGGTIIKLTVPIEAQE